MYMMLLFLCSFFSFAFQNPDLHSSSLQCKETANTIKCIKLTNILCPFPRKKKFDGSHTSILCELKELISRRVGFVIRPYVVGSIFRTSPPYIRGDFAIAHKVICVGIHSLSFF